MKHPIEKNLYNLSEPQISIYHAEFFYPGTNIFNIAGYAKFKVDVNIHVLDFILNELSKKNEALRISFIQMNGNAMQYIREYKCKKVELLDLSNKTDNEAAKIITDRLKEPINIFSDSLYCPYIIQYPDGTTGYALKLHHLIVDAWGLSLLVSQVSNFLNQLDSDENIDSISFPSSLTLLEREKLYVLSDGHKKDQMYWEDKFSTPSEFTFHKQISRHFLDSKAVRKNYKLSRRISNALKVYCKEMNITPFVLFMTAVFTYFLRVGGKEDIAIGTPTLNRNGVKEKNAAGLFAKVMPIRAKLNENLCFFDNIKIIEKEINGLLKHQNYSYNDIQQYYRKSHHTQDNLYDIVFSYQNAKYDDAKNFPAENTWVFMENEITPLTIHVSDREAQNNFNFNIDYLSSLFSDWEIEGMYTHITNLLLDGIVNSSKPLSQLKLISKREEKELLYTYNGAEASYPKSKLVHQLFEEQVVKTPDNIAIEHDNLKITYRELNEKANQLSRILKEKGVTRQTIVAIMAERSIEMVLAAISIIKAGGAYLPILPSYPDDRKRYILENSNAKILLTKNCNVENLDFKYERIEIDMDSLEKVANKTNPEPINSPSDLLYVIYTSGSTGKPKGVMIEHKNVVRLMKNSKFQYYFNSEDVWTLFHSFAFDFSVWEMYGALLYGGKLLIIDEKMTLNHDLFLKYISDKRVTVLNQTPSSFSNFLIEKNEEIIRNLKLRYVIFGGEEFKPFLIKEWRRLNKGIKFVNMYGITETTVHCTFKKITYNEITTNISNIGKPIPTLKLLLLDKNLKLLPKGIEGEIYVLGDGVARGYLNNETLTNERFIKCEYSKEKAYRSGDMAKILDNGDLVYLGRKDNQVQIRGFRVELGEIESKIKEFPWVRQVTIIPEKTDFSYRIIAFIVSDKILNADVLKGELLRTIPSYMVPSEIYQLKSIPLTSNGKVDIKKMMDERQLANLSEIKPPISKIEKLMSKTFGEILNKEYVGINQNFFNIGGDSINVLKLAFSLQKVGLNFTIEEIYNNGTIEELLKSSRPKNTIPVNHIINIQNPDSPFIKKDSPNSHSILITGGTGFLGIHILKELYDQNIENIYCLIRGNSLDGQIRLKNILSYYFGSDVSDQMICKIHIVSGDITKKNLSSFDDNFGLTDVIHCAANVKHFGNYKDFYNTNVLGTENIIDFCLNRNITMHHISTTSVSGNYLVETDKEAIFTENHLYINQKYEQNVYIDTKFEAEVKVLNAIQNKGLKSRIYRVGNLTWGKNCSKLQINKEENFFYNLLQELISLEKISDEILDHYVEITPVDQCASAIVSLVNTKTDQICFHLYNDNYIKIRKILSYLNISNQEKQSATEFVQYLDKLIRFNQDKYHALMTLFYRENKLSLNSNIALSNSVSNTILSNLDFRWDQIDEEYIKNIKV